MSAASCSKVNAHTPTKTDSLNTRLFLNDSIICGYFCSNNLMEDTSSNLINKVAEGSPHVVEYIKQNKIDLVINTTEKKQAIIDSFTIRRTSVDLNVPYYTNLRSAEILIKSLITLKNKPLSVKPIQIHHSF